MKKISVILIFTMIFALSASIFSGCNVNQKAVFDCDASFNSNKYIARVGDIIELSENSFNITPSNLEAKPIFSSQNKNIADVNALTGEIKCLAEGITTIYGQVKGEDGKYVGDSFILTVQQKLVYATDFNLEKEDNLLVGINSQNDFNILTLVGNNITALQFHIHV